MESKYLNPIQFIGLFIGIIGFILIFLIAKPICESMGVGFWEVLGMLTFHIPFYYNILFLLGYSFFNTAGIINLYVSMLKPKKVQINFLKVLGISMVICTVIWMLILYSANSPNFSFGLSKNLIDIFMDPVFKSSNVNAIELKIFAGFGIILYIFGVFTKKSIIK